MSFSDDKLGVLNEIEILKANYDTPDLRTKKATSLESISDEDAKVAMFMFDLVVLLVGSESLNEIVGRVMKKVLKSAEDNIKKALFKNSQLMSGTKDLPAFLRNGYEVDLKKLDKKKQFRLDPTSTEGSKLYGKAANSMDRDIYKAINDNTVVNHKNLVNIEFANATQKVKYTPTTTNFQSIDRFLGKFIMGLDILDEDAISKMLLNELFGNPTDNIKTEAEKDDDIIIKDLINQVIKSDDVSNLILTETNPISVLKTNIVDLGCGYYEMSITDEEYNQALSGLSSTQSNEGIGDVFNSLLNKNANPLDTNTKKDSEAKIGFFKKIITNLLNSTVGNIVKSPDLSIYLNLVNNFKNESNTSFKDTKELLKENLNVVKDMSNSIECLINEELFEIVSKEIKKIAKKQIKKLIREKLEIFTRIVKGNLPI